MNCTYRITIFAVLMSTGFAVSAEQVFEKVDKQGGVEFSDQPSPDAKMINVQPNVVEVAPVKSSGGAQPAPPAGGAKMPADSSPPEVIREGGGTGYLYDDEKRAKRKKHEEKVRSEGKAVRQPARGEAGRGAAAGAAGAARGGAHGR